jgi:CubicO group peptidase (beta-lactamase class C family)
MTPLTTYTGFVADQSPMHGFEVIGRAIPTAIRRARGYSGENALNVLSGAVAHRAFPGAAFAVLRDGETVLQGAVGRFTYEEASEAITLSTVFDLASVTKVIATTSMAMLLIEHGHLNLQARLVDLVPEFDSEDERRQQITIEMLLAHSSGLPAYVKLFEQVADRKSLVRSAVKIPLTSDPGTRVEYSDIGFILLGETLQRIADEPLDVFCAREIFGRLGMEHTCFKPADAKRLEIPPTVNDKIFRHRVIQGEVHDENASVMGGVAGQAGVFSNTSDVMKFSASVLGAGFKLFQPETVTLFTRRQASPAGTSRALGWDTPSPPSQSGRHFSPHSFGHLGYTGTSLWIDGERKVAVALLTNRTWPDNQSQAIRKVRPAFHDAVMEEVLGIR